MTIRLSDLLDEQDIGMSILRSLLVIIFIFLAFLMPAFEPGTEMAIFLATMAIIIVSILNSNYARERTELMREQNELIQSQMVDSEVAAENDYSQTELGRYVKSDSDVGEEMDLVVEPEKELEYEVE